MYGNHEEVPAVAENRTSPCDCDERYREPPATILVRSHGANGASQIGFITRAGLKLSDRHRLSGRFLEYNNPVGVPLELLSTPHQFAVLVNFWSLMSTSTGRKPASTPQGTTASSSLISPKTWLTTLSIVTEPIKGDSRAYSNG